MARYDDGAWRARLRAAVVCHSKKHWAIADDASLSRILRGRSTFPSLESIVSGSRMPRRSALGVTSSTSEGSTSRTKSGPRSRRWTAFGCAASAERYSCPTQRLEDEQGRKRMPGEYRDLGACVVYHATGDSMAASTARVLRVRTSGRTNGLPRKPLAPLPAPAPFESDRRKVRGPQRSPRSPGLPPRICSCAASEDRAGSGCDSDAEAHRPRGGRSWKRPRHRRFAAPLPINSYELTASKVQSPARCTHRC